MACCAFLIPLLFSGLNTVTSYRQFYLVEEYKNWKAAQSYCREKHTDLASVHSIEEVNQLIYIMHNQSISWAWIGLHEDINDWQWSLDSSKKKGKSDSQFHSWGLGQPDNQGSRERCVSMDSNGTWSDTFCNNTGYFVCYADGDGSQNYVLIKQNKTWPEAQNYCRQNYTDLVSIRNHTENKQVQLLVPDGEWVWIGMYREQWKWSNGDALSFQNWDQGYPNKWLIRHCVIMFGGEQSLGKWFNLSFQNWTQGYGDNYYRHCEEIEAMKHDPGKWLPISCNSVAKFFCYRDFPEEKQRLILRVKLTARAALNVNDPSVSEAILQRAKEGLVEQGIQGNLKWREQPDGNIFHLEDEDEEEEEEGREQQCPELHENLGS